MLRSKKIISSVLPKIRELPEEYYAYCAEKANDGKILFQLNRRRTREKAGYYCLKCGYAGEVEREMPICKNCCNTEFRSVNSNRYDMLSEEQIRYVQIIDEYVVICDIEFTIEESVTSGIKIVPKDKYCIVLSESDYAIFASSQYYQGTERKKVWSAVKDVYDYKKLSPKLIIADESVNENSLVKKLWDSMKMSTSDFVEKVKLVAVGISEQTAVFPNVEFASIDESVISGVKEKWDPVIRTHPVKESDTFVMVESWCPCCGKYHKRLERASDSYSIKCCKTCGCQAYYHHKDEEYLVHLIDVEETKSGEIVFRIHGLIKEKLIDGDVVSGQDPIVVRRLNKKFVNYIYIDHLGKPYFFDENKTAIDKLQIQIYKQHGFQDQPFIYSEQAKEQIKHNECIKRTGFHLLVDANTSPKYFEYLARIPEMEIFAKSKMFLLIQDIMKKDIPDLPPFIRGTSKQRRLTNLSKTQLNSLRSQYVTLKHLDAYLQCLSKDPTALFEDFIGLSTMAHERHVLDILRVGVPGLTVKKIREYISRVDDMQCCPPSDSMQLWSDYLRMLRASRCDLTDTKLVYTHSLKREHDKVARKMTQINDEKLIAAFEQKASDNEWLEYKGKQLSAVVPHQLTDLYEEGRKLSHCVGSYARSVIDGQSIIVFLRRNNNLDVPYCTVELREKQIVQVRGWNNCEGMILPDIRSFLKNWAEKKGLILEAA